jgi:proteasome accessory factor A
MSEYTIWLRQGVTALVLAMIEDGAVTRDLALRDPVRAIKEVSHDVSLRRTVELAAGKKITAIQLQREYCELARKYQATRELPAWAPEILDHWQATLDALERDPSELVDRIDWIAKQAMIDAFLARKGLDWDSPQAQMLDLQFHDVRPEKGLAYLLERQGKLRRLVSDEEIVRAITEPPEDTRAYFRGQCLKRYGEAVFGVNWDSISFGVGDEPIKRVMMAEPLKGSKAHVQDLLDRSPTAADLVRNLRT